MKSLLNVENNLTYRFLSLTIFYSKKIELLNVHAKLTDSTSHHFLNTLVKNVRIFKNMAILLSCKRMDVK